MSVVGKAVKSGKPMASGSVIASGETVLTEDGAEVRFQMKGRAALRLKNAGKLVFDEIADSVALSLDYGSLLSVVSKTGKKFVITTPAITAGVRGTAFYMESRSIDQTYVCLCEGVLSLNSSDSAMEIRAPDRKKHHPVMVSLDPSGKISAGPAGMINHTNADIEALEAVLNK